MPATTFGERISHVLESALATGAEPPGRLDEPSLGLLSLRGLVRTVTDDDQLTSRREQILAAFIRCYRRHPASAWSAIVLAALRPSLEKIAGRLQGTLPGIETEDLHQQILLEALGVAGSIPLGDTGGDLMRRLEQRVEAATLRRLAQLAEARGESGPATEEQAPSTFAEEANLDLFSKGDPESVLRVLLFLYRTEVLGGVLTDIALQRHTTPAAIQRRHVRVVRRLLREEPELLASFAAALHSVA